MDSNDTHETCWRATDPTYIPELVGISEGQGFPYDAKAQLVESALRRDAFEQAALAREAAQP